MKSDAIERWLRRQTLLEALLNVPVGAICLLASLVALAFVTGGVFFISLVIFKVGAAFVKSNFDYNLRNWTFFCSVFCGLFVLWLFVSHYRRNAEYLRFSKYRTGKVNVSGAGFSGALHILLSGPRGEDGIFKQFLYTAPQWFISAISMFYKSVTLLRMDIPSCAKILIILFETGSRVSLADLARMMPDCNAPKIFPQLRDVAGVIFLQNEPSGISITSDLRAELARVLGVKISPRAEPRFYRQTKSAPPPRTPPPPRVATEEEIPGPHQVLGISRSASLAEIKAAYRKQIKQCHPDRFATLNKDWQQMAEQRAKSVNAAYEILTDQAASRNGRA